MDIGSRGQSPLGDDDLFLFNEGTHRNLGSKLGARLLPGGEGARFGVWAPAASAVAVIGDFNGWTKGEPLAPRGSSGIWEGEVAGARQGNVYKFAIETRWGEHLEKADPIAMYAEVPPRTGSVIWDLNYDWGDRAW
ncbi:MAG: 1,4-alpha-glucan branching enzyme, partial [Acidimicrobiales bacterium]